MKSKRLVLDENFEVVKLDENPTRPDCFRVDLSVVIKEGFIEFLRTNAKYFKVSPDKIPYVDPSVTYHQLNINPSSW